MPEYVIEANELPANFTMGDTNELFGVVSRKITRCGNCRHYLPGEQVCDRFGEHPSATGVWFETDPTGFCKWGETDDDAGMEHFFRFPKNRRSASASIGDQAQKILEEALETSAAVRVTEPPARVCEEALDVICAAEGLLRKFPRETIEDALGIVARKGTRRGDWL